MEKQNTVIQNLIEKMEAQANKEARHIPNLESQMKEIVCRKTISLLRESLPEEKEGIPENEFKAKCDELWDDFSETIGEDIGSLEYFAGRTVITLSQYFKLTANLYKAYNQ